MFLSICVIILSIIIFFFIMNNCTVLSLGIQGLSGIFLVSVLISCMIVGGIYSVGQWLFGGILFLLKWVLIIGGILVVLGLVAYVYEKHTQKEENSSDIEKE